MRNLVVAVAVLVGVGAGCAVGPVLASAPAVSYPPACARARQIVENFFRLELDVNRPGDPTIAQVRADIYQMAQDFDVAANACPALNG